MTHAKQRITSKIARSPRRTVAIGLALGALITVPVLATGPAGFGPPTTVSSNIFGPIHSSAVKPGIWGVRLETQGNTLVGIDKLVVQPGGVSGWHTHAGLVLISVTSGTLLWTDGTNCRTTTYPAGSSFVEQENHVHLVRNASNSVIAEFTGVQLRPDGTAGRIDAAAPSNNCGI